RHEEASVLAAEGWALATAEVGVAAVTAGPGLANALPGLVEAQAAGAPVLLLAGRTGLAQRGRGAVQDLDQLALVAPTTKWHAECLRTERIPGHVAAALHQARSGSPGVAYLEVPLDVLVARADPQPTEHPTGPPEEPARSVPPPEDLARAVEILASAERPVALAGSGAFFSGAADALRAFAERTGIPVITTSAARGLLDDDHPGCLGGLIHGGIALASADACLLLGSRFNANLLYGGPPLFPAGQRVIQVDVRPEHHGGERRPDLALAGDVAATLRALAAAWSRPPGALAPWAEEARRGAEASRRSWEREAEGPARGLHPGWVARELARFADAGGPHTFVSDGGDSVVWGLAMAPARRPGTHLTIGSAMGTLGVGLPFALAARAARPEEPVYLFTGDGALGMTAMELETAARHRLGVLVVVANNGPWREPSRMRHDLLAEAAGGYGERVEDPGGLGPALERAARAARDGPAVIDAVVDPSAVSSFMRHAGALQLM
ncbi:MAG TPA: thiamine pyrophosphate-binding protein, partial [Actinomycetota bacterium]|nr:thiamine pyrophosphate-binding protein [Actinomycetota bacterium]